MTATWSAEWQQACRAGLLTQVNRVGAAYSAGATERGADASAPSGPAIDAAPEREVESPMLDRIVEAFNLTAFERDLMVLAAAVELDPTLPFADRPWCEGGIALINARDRLPGADWSALSGSAALRRWQLISVDAGDPLHGRLRMDERTLLALLGVSTVDASLQRLARPLESSREEAGTGSIAIAAIDSAHRWTANPGARLPVLHVVGPDPDANRQLVAAASRHVGLVPWEIDAASLPVEPDQIDALSVVLEREVTLADIVLVVQDDGAEPAARRAIQALADRTQAPLVVAAREARRDWRRGTIHVELPAATQQEVVAAWREALGPAADELGDTIDRLAHEFALPLGRVRDVAGDARAAVGRGGDVRTSVWHAARTSARGALEGLAQRITTATSWADLVLPEPQLRTLHEISAHVRARQVVERSWGFAERRAGDLAVSCLFHGPSGVGKTLAARVIAADLELDLYRIDLSQTVSKYIGETEKNLKSLFDAAEESGAVLVFDEADALFGRRSDVHDAHDRHANIEVSYLLQRMESYRGLAILTTNLPGNLDPAFMRRLRYAVAFPLPDLAARALLWSRAFPPAAPTRDIDTAVLARLSVSGASIANIALGAAVLAADTGQAIGMAHVLRAAQSEYAKLDRSISAVELAGWPPDAVDERTRRATTRRVEREGRSVVTVARAQP